MIDAFHLPALSAPPTSTWPYADGKVELRIPQLTPSLLAQQITALREARSRWLAERPVASIIQAIDSVARRLLDPADPLRRAAEAALPPVSGYSPPMTRHVLDRMAADWRADALRDLLHAEFTDPRALDRFVPRSPTTSTRAFGPPLSVHVFSGNVPGVAVTSLIRALLVKSACLGKTAAGEPVLPALFARGLAEADAELGHCLAVTYWPGGAEPLEAVALSAADAVLVYGSDETIASVRARTPTATRVVGYGHHLSFGMVSRAALADNPREIARRAALDAATFDQQGCVSPHLFYVEEGGSVSPAEWAALLATAMQRIERELPRGTLAPGESSAIRQLRGEAEFAEIAGTGTRLFASTGGTAWTVIYEPDPKFAGSCLNRTVRVKPVAELEQVPALVEPFAHLLQTVGIAGMAGEVLHMAEVLGKLGASRVAPLGTMSWPPAHWHHDGQPPVRTLVRWCDVEGVPDTT